MSKVLDELHYADSHEWVKVEGDLAIVGITDYAQHALGDIVYVDMPDIDDEVTAGEEFGAVESVKAASDLFSPISGTVIATNEELVDDPGLINRDAYGTWIMKVAMTDPSEVERLLDAEGYKKICE